MLAQLLAKGSTEAPTVEATTTHPLFAGGKEWVHSITTIAAPNQGSVLPDGMALMGDLVKTAVVGLFSSLGALEDSVEDIYDVKLDQWGISPKAPDETLVQYLERVMTSPIFKPGFQDIALWSLTTEGAKQENAWVETLPTVYYFSYATSDTHASRDIRLRNVHRLNKTTMMLPLQPLASFMGGRYTRNHGFPDSWQENDGQVNTASMLKDASGSYVEFTGVARRGVWNGQPVLKSMDHFAVEGLTRDYNVFEALYSVHAKRLSELPAEYTVVALETSHEDKRALLVKSREARRRPEAARGLAAHEQLNGRLGTLAHSGTLSTLDCGTSAVRRKKATSSEEEDNTFSLVASQADSPPKECKHDRPSCCTTPPDRTRPRLRWLGTRGAAGREVLGRYPGRLPGVEQANVRFSCHLAIVSAAGRAIHPSNMSMNEDDATEMVAITTPPSDFQASQAAPSTAPVYGDAYVTHFTLVLRTVARERPDFRRLYSRRELALAEHFLDRLTPLEQHVYARLFQRKGPWFKTSSLLSYFTRRPWKAVNEESATEETSIKTDVEVIDVDAIEEANVIEPTPEPTVVDTQPESVLGYLPEAPDHRQVQSTIQTLVNSGLLVTLPLLSPVFMSKEDQEAQLLLALEAIHHSATGPELTVLWKKLSGGKTKIPTSSSSRGNGSSSASSSPARKTNGKSGCESTTTTGNGTSKSEIFQALKRLVMTQRRIDGSRIPIAKMMHAIWLDNYPLLQQRNSKDEILLVVRFSDQARELFARMHRLFYFQAAMPLSGGNMSVSLSASARVKSFQIIAQERSRSSASGDLDAVSYSGSNAVTQQWPGLLVIFKKVQYPQYQITIRHPIFRSTETYICYEIASRLHRLMSALELEMVVAQVTKDEDLVPSEWSLTDDLYDNLPELTAFQRLILPPAEGSALEEWQGVACGQFEKMLVEWTSMDALVLEARKCLRAYSHFHLQAAAGDENVDRPAFFVKCNAGYHLARVLHHASALYEKQRQYARAVVVLRDLLATPSFLARKRAHWYERLALNLEHLKQHREAKRVCEEALRDKDVLGAGVIALQRRLDRLIRRKDLQGDVDIKLDDEQGPPPEKKRKINPDEDDFVNLVSSSDEEFVETEPAIIESVVPAIQATSTRYEYPQTFIVGRPLNKSTGEKSRFIGYDDEPCNVEQLVLQYYHSQTDGEHSSGGGWYGVHCEGRVLTNIFGLLMWPVLYAPVPDVFQSPYQSAPLDFGFAKVFYEARRNLIDPLVADIETRLTMEEILERVKSTWQSHEGEITRFVSWGSDVSLRFHLLVVAAMGKSALAKLLRHMATSEEYHRAQNGLPDLLMIRVKADKAEDVGSLGQYLSDSHIGTLDVYKFCGMSYSTNLNSHKENDACSKTEPDVKEVTQSTQDEKPDDVKSSAGVADLIDGDALWQLEFKLVEVKGPRDRLSDQQERWLQLFNQDMGIDASVMHVVEEEKELEKKRQRATNGGKGKLKETKDSKVESAPSKRARRK